MIKLAFVRVPSSINIYGLTNINLSVDYIYDGINSATFHFSSKYPRHRGELLRNLETLGGKV